VSDLLKHIERSIGDRKLIRPGQSVLVAVSGGLDSMVLLRVLTKLGKTRRWKLTVAHFNHRLRGRSSDADERLVGAAAEKMGLPFISGGEEVKEFARGHGFSLEMAARKLRHEFLAKTAAKERIKTIALAHHADDQVELFFLRLLRGAGSEGLAGMKWRSPSPADGGIELIRPMLDQTKSELRNYAAREKIIFREDATNARLDIKRNRVRGELIPLLMKRYQPALKRVILREMEVLSAEAQVIDAMARRWLKGKRRRFEELPVALQRHCLGLQLPEAGVAVSFGLIEELRESANCPIAVSEGMTIYRDEKGRIRAREVRVEGFDAKKEAKYELKGGAGEINFGETRVFWEIKRVANGTFRAANKGANCEFFDAERVGGTVILRHWRAGDRFQPSGMAKPIKLQDLFTNQKVPRAERHRRTVACAADGVIFWVEGLRMAERFKLDRKTTRRLKWRWQRL
jgi:tRNA(Ile)-lysidine synthase